MNAYVRHLKAWAIALVGVPLLVLFVLGLFPAGWMLAIVVAFYFYAVPAMLVGSPHFATEFMVPSTSFAFFTIALFWLVAVGAFAALSYHFARRADQQGVW